MRRKDLHTMSAMLEIEDFKREITYAKFAFKLDFTVDRQLGPTFSVHVCLNYLYFLINADNLSFGVTSYEINTNITPPCKCSRLTTYSAVYT